MEVYVLFHVISVYCNLSYRNLSTLAISSKNYFIKQHKEMSSSVKHTLEHLEEQQNQRLLKKKKQQEIQKTEVIKNECRCSVESQYDNFDGVEDELDLKVKFCCLQKI